MVVVVPCWAGPMFEALGQAVLGGGGGMGMAGGQQQQDDSSKVRAHACQALRAVTHWRAYGPALPRLLLMAVHALRYGGRHYYNTHMYAWASAWLFFMPVCLSVCWGCGVVSASPFCPSVSALVLHLLRLAHPDHHAAALAHAAAAVTAPSSEQQQQEAQALQGEAAATMGSGDQLYEWLAIRARQQQQQSEEGGNEKEEEDLRELIGKIEAATRSELLRLQARLEARRGDACDAAPALGRLGEQQQQEQEEEGWCSWRQQQQLQQAHDRYRALGAAMDRANSRHQQCRGDDEDEQEEL